MSGLRDGTGHVEAGEGTKIHQALDGAGVFITGGLGFLGSVLLESLLRLCPSVKTIFLLIRKKGSQTGEQRLANLIARRQLFGLVRGPGGYLRAELGAKVVVMEGDCCLPDLGLSWVEQERLREECQYVVHSAASIDFFQHIHVLLRQNYKATRLTAEFAATLPKLRGFLFVSTAYVNAHRPRGSHVEEAFYPLTQENGLSVYHASLAAKLAHMSPGAAEKEAAALLRAVKLPTNYMLTKHMAESLVAERHSASFPVAIVRPSIVSSLAGAPCPGYFGNTAGLTNAVRAFSSALARFSCHNPYAVYDLVPCDVVVGVIIGSLAALDTISLYQEAEDQAGTGQGAFIHPTPLILHAATSTTHPFYYGEGFVRVVYPYWLTHPPTHRVTNRVYKPIDARHSFFPSTTLAFKAKVLRAEVRVQSLALALQLAGKGKPARVIKEGWKVWRLYNTEAMDFHLFFCSKNVRQLAAWLEPTPCPAAAKAAGLMEGKSEGAIAGVAARAVTVMEEIGEAESAFREVEEGVSAGRRGVGGDSAVGSKLGEGGADMQQPPLKKKELEGAPEEKKLVESPSEESLHEAEAGVGQQGLKLLWTKEDSWWPYLLAHQRAVRARFYPDTVKAAADFTLDEELVTKDGLLSAPSDKAPKHLRDYFKEGNPLGELPSCRYA